MSLYGKHPRLTRDTAPPDAAVWHWFVCNGPHGAGFQWANPVLGAGGELRLLRRLIGEQSTATPDFEAHARAIAVESLQSEDPELTLKGIHVLAAVGTDEEMASINPLVTATNLDIAKHARAALFERRIKKKKPQQNRSTESTSSSVTPRVEP